MWVSGWGTGHGKIGREVSLFILRKGRHPAM